MKKKILLSIMIGMNFFISGCGVKIIHQNSEFENNLTYNKVVTPSDKQVTLNIVDWSDSTKEQRKELNQLFMEQHPNVTINYTTLTQAQFNESVISGIRSGNAPDLFPLPQTVTFEMALNENWFIPLNTYLDEDFFKDLNDSAFNENLTSRDGKVYLLPEAQEIPSTLMFYNQNVLSKAGISLDNLPKTWEEFASLTQMISKKGKGEYFGLVTSGGQKNRIDLEVRSLAQLAGGKIGYTNQILLKNGENQLSSQGVLDAFDFYAKLYDSGSFHPDSTFISAPEARKLFAENKAAFIIQGAWCIPVWQQQNPDLHFSVMQLPVPGENNNNKMVQPFTQGWMGISSTSEHPDIAAEYLKYLYSYEYQKKLVNNGGFISIRKDIDSQEILDPIMRNYYQYSLEQSEAIENPVTKNDYASLVYTNMRMVNPDFGDIAASILSGNVKYKEQLIKYSSDIQYEIEQSLNVISKKYEISKDVFEFQSIK